MKVSLPSSIDGNGLLVGYSIENNHRRIPVGFSFGDPECGPESGYMDPYLFEGEGHLLTVAPTGAGKGVSCVVPALLRHSGDVVVLDPKGENYAVTARHRREMGQVVHLLDPFGDVPDRENGAEASSLNVFDFLPYLSDDNSGACRSLAHMLMPSENGTDRDPFWENSAINIFAALVDHYNNSHGRRRSVWALAKELAAYPGAHVDAIAAEVHAMQVIDEEFDRIVSTNRIAAQDLEAEVSQWIKYRGDPESGCDDDDLHRRIIALSGGLISNSESWYLLRTMSEILEMSQSQRLTPYNTDDDDLLAGDTRLPSGVESVPIAILRLLSSDRPMARSVAGMIRSSPDKTWGSILVTLQNGLLHLQGKALSKFFGGHSIDLRAFQEGSGSSVYLVFPPSKLRSHAPIFRTIVSGLISVLTARRRRPEKSTLFLLDEIAQLGRMEEFVTAMTLLRGYGVQVWSFWQDLSQIQNRYSEEWETIVNNCKVFQAFGCSTPLMSRSLAKIHEVDIQTIQNLDDDEMLLSIIGDETVIARKPCYWRDPAFAGQFDPNFLRQSISDRNPERATLVGDARLSERNKVTIEGKSIRRQRVSGVGISEFDRQVEVRHGEALKASKTLNIARSALAFGRLDQASRSQLEELVKTVHDLSLCSELPSEAMLTKLQDLSIVALKKPVTG